MTHPKILMKADEPPGAAASDFTALADQLIRDAWHLPPDGDQSWREQDARRIFSGDGKRHINDEPSAQEQEEAPEADPEPALEPHSRTPRAMAVLLPVALATVIVFFTVTLSAPEILAARYWAAPGTGAPTPAAAIAANSANAAPAGAAVAHGDLRPSLARDERVDTARAVRVANNAEIRKPAPQQLRHTVSDVSAEAPRKIGPAVRVGSATSPGPSSLQPRRRATRLPPIGAAYFASHAPVAASKSTAVDWKVEAARWDEMAAKIRAKRDRYLKAENIAAAQPSDAHAFP